MIQLQKIVSSEEKHGGHNVYCTEIFYTGSRLKSFVTTSSFLYICLLVLSGAQCF